jgi:hypothetical protein
MKLRFTIPRLALADARRGIGCGVVGVLSFVQCAATIPSIL